MQTTLTSSIIKQHNYSNLANELDFFVINFNFIKHNLYKDIISFYHIHNINSLSKDKINILKSTYQTQYNINARQFNSIYADLMGNMNSVLELNKGYLEECKDTIKSLSKTIKSKQTILNDLNIKINGKDYIFKKVDIVNLAKLKEKLYYLKKRLIKANNKLKKLTLIEKTGNPHLCFGSNKLFRQQFQINSINNQTQFKTLKDWKTAWIESRNKSFVLVGSSDETTGNTNCQIKHIENDIYELKVNLYPKAVKLQDRYITVQIKVHNDKNNLIQNILNNPNLKQALTYRFYKDHKNNTYKVFISLDKLKQQQKIISSKLLGTIGIDINANHLSVAETDRFGNLLMVKDIPLNLKGKTSNQSKDNISLAVKEITDYAVKVNKPIVIEKLDFSGKKAQLKDSFNKKYNVMLSSFAYSKIIELVKSRSFDKGIEVIEVNPAYTSIIGKFKYQNQYKLTTHQAASFTIARRGLLSYNKTIKVEYHNIDKETKEISIVEKEKVITIINKEKTISNRRSKHSLFELPVRNIQRKNNDYWREVEQNYTKAKKNKAILKKKALIQGKQDLTCEKSVVANNFGVKALEPIVALNPDLDVPF